MTDILKKTGNLNTEAHVARTPWGHEHSDL